MKTFFLFLLLIPNLVMAFCSAPSAPFGGALLFFQNEVIGVNVMKQVANDTQGLGFAIHHSEVINFLYN